MKEIDNLASQADCAFVFAEPGNLESSFACLHDWEFYVICLIASNSNVNKNSPRNMSKSNK